MSKQLLFYRGFTLENSTFLAEKIGGHLPYLHSISLENPFKEILSIETELYGKMKTCFKNEVTFNNSLQFAIRLALTDDCCSLFQICLLEQNILQYNPLNASLTFESQMAAYALTI